jgi:hypothetical protein
MRESNSRDRSHNPVPKPFDQSRHKTSGAGRVNRTLVGEVQALCTATVLDQQTMELARSLELRSGAYRAPALPVELYQRSWRGDSNADHGLTRPALFLLSYTSTKLLPNSGGGGENCTPDDLLCRQTPCCLGYTALQLWSGVRELHPCFRTGDPEYCSYTNSAWSEQRESNSRHQLGRLRHQPLYHARNGGR